GGGRPRQLRRLLGTRRHPVRPLAERICYAVSGGAAGAVGALGIALYQHLSGLAESPGAPVIVQFLFHGYSRIYMVIAAGVTWTMLAVLTADLLFTGLTSYHRYGEGGREWSARAAGFLAAAALGWLSFSAVVLYGPPASAAILGMVGGIAGLVTLALGNSAKTAALARQAGDRLSLTTILSIATLIFIVALTILFSKIGRTGLDHAASVLGAEDRTDIKAWFAMGASIALIGVSVVASYWINVNRFSLHAVYRNRLIRAFLGAARASQRQTGKSHSNPDPFTGIDQADNLTLKSIWLPAGQGGGRCLFHVVNTALNVVASKNLAWQERKAEPFVMTPLACGNPFVGFVPTRFFGARRDGITLGTAMAISGAAVSPNQGYHSSPIIGLLLICSTSGSAGGSAIRAAGPNSTAAKGRSSASCRCSTSWRAAPPTPVTTSTSPMAGISTISGSTRWFAGAAALSWSATLALTRQAPSRISAMRYARYGSTSGFASSSTAST